MSPTNMLALAMASAFVLYIVALIWVFVYTRAWEGPEASRVVRK